MTRYEGIRLALPASGTASGQHAAVAEIAFGPLTELAGFMLRLAQLEIFASFFRDFGASGITPGQIGILVAISRNPGARQGVLADALHIKWSNMAKIVRLLEDQKLVERRVPVEFVTYPRENHGFTEPRHIQDRWQRYLVFFGKYLGNPPVTEPRDVIERMAKDLPAQQVATTGP